MALWTLAQLERAVATFSDQLQCVICLCAYVNPVSLPCNHCFCEECIHRALELKAQCPICKIPATKRRLRYDKTVQELLQATDMLRAVPVGDTTSKVAGKRTQEKLMEMKKTCQVADDKVAATCMQQRSSRCAKRNIKTTTPTLMDIWMSGGLRNEVTVKKEVTSIAPAGKTSCPSQLMQDTNSQMSPAIFNFAAMSRVNGTSNGDKAHTILTPQCRSGPMNAIDEKNADSCVTKNEIVAANVEWKDTVDVDIVIAETQLETQKQELRRTVQSQSRTDANTVVQDRTQVKSEKIRRRQSIANEASTTDATAKGSMLMTPNLPTRRQSVTTDVRPNAARSKMLRKVANSNEKKVVLTNVAANTLSVTVDSQSPYDVEAEVLPQHFQVGEVVEVIERQWVGINKQGGAARITNVHGDGFYAVNFVIGGKDNCVPGSFIRGPAKELISDLTPSCSVKIRQQRRRASDKTPALNNESTKTIESADSIKAESESMLKTKRKRLCMVFLCSGFKKRRMQQIIRWADLLGAEVVQSWSNDVTHLIVKCVSKNDESEDEDPSMEQSDFTSSPQSNQEGRRELFGDLRSGRWVKVRSLKYLKALAGGRWIVSDEWLQACAEHSGYVKEVNYEVNGYWKGRKIHNAVMRSRLTREKLLQLSSPDIDHSTVGTMLFADFCFHIIGEFLPPMPPVTELQTLICIGGGELIALVSDKTLMRENRARKLIIVSDKINPIALRQQTRQLKTQSKMKAVSSAIIVSYLWVINSISEANLREFP